MVRFVAVRNFLVFFVGTLIFSCQHAPEDIVLNPENIDTIQPPVDTVVCDSSDVTYSGIVFPILNTYCISCHSGAVPSGALDFTDFGDLAFVAQSGQLTGSLKHLDGFSPMPQNAGKLSVCEIALIEKWIRDTIFIDPPDTTACDSSHVTYYGSVFPIFEANCLSCHAPPAPQAGIDLTDFQDVAFLAQNGKLLGAIRHETGFVPMPQDAPQLTDCEIGIIQKWINDTVFPDPGIPCDPDTVYFQNTVLPLLQSSCGTTGCHDPVTQQNEVILTSYFYIMQTAEVVPFEPNESKLWEVIEDDFQSDRMPPPPAPPLNADQKQIIYKWIQQGALDNYCELEPCDSVNVTFSGTVFPIIQNNCYGCHSGPAPTSGISLTNYNEIKSAASIPAGNAGSLLGVITWTSGNLPMPQNGNKLSVCNIAKIRKWIDDGMPEN